MCIFHFGNYINEREGERELFQMNSNLRILIKCGEEEERVKGKVYGARKLPVNANIVFMNETCCTPHK